MLATASAIAKGAAIHDRVVIASSPAELRSPHVNTVHVRRCLPVHPKHFTEECERLGAGFRQRVTALSSSPEPAARALVENVATEQVREYLYDDAQQLIKMMGQEYGLEQCNVKLEVLSSQMCPKWHADHVNVRLLVSLCGQGTFFIANKHVKRGLLWQDGPVTTVASVDERYAQQAQAGDIVILKGHKWGNGANFGNGAVHKSPEVDGLRMLLMIDDVIQQEECGCGVDHTH